MNPISILDVGVASAAGLGMAEFAACLRGAALPSPSPMREALCAGGHLPPRAAHWMTDFDPVAHLGRKGVVNLDRTTQLSILLCRSLLDAMPDQMVGGRDRIGVVLGTSGGSLKSIADFIRSTYAGSAPHLVSPMQFPNTVMNSAAAQCAIWNGLRGVNSTVCAGDLSGFAALRYAMRMLRLDHARLLLAGAVEEYCEFTAFSHETMEPDPAMLQGEGGALFALSAEPTDAAIGELLAVRLGLLPVTQPVVGAAVAIGRLLHDAGLSPQDIAWWSPSATGLAGQLEADAVASALGAVSPPDAPIILPCIADMFGHVGGASVSLQLAGCLAVAPAGNGLVTASDSAGQFGCALLRRSPRTVH